MKEQIVLKEIGKSSSEVWYNFSCTSGLRELFNFEHTFRIRYKFTKTKLSASIDKVPDSILSIPFLGNVLPIVWLSDAELHIPQVDKAFYSNLEYVKKGFAQMYPKLHFRGSCVVDQVVNNGKEGHQGNPICFFSGGVDAWQTLCEHREEKPILLAMFGADFYLENTKGNSHFERYLCGVAQRFDCELISFESTLRQFINESALNKKWAAALGFHWWHRIQHGMGVITHAAPIAFLNNSSTVYFASSYSHKDSAIHPCATAPTIDNHIFMAGAKVIHDGYEFTRQDKIYNICHFSKKHHIPLFIHVCWGQYVDSHNCSRCEKCQRTWMGILAEGFNPNEFGFKYEGKISSDQVQVTLRRKESTVLTREMWEQVLYRFKMNAGILEEYPELKWTTVFQFDPSEHCSYRMTSRIIQRFFTWCNLQRCRFMSHLLPGKRALHYKTKKNSLRSEMGRVKKDKVLS